MRDVVASWKVVGKPSCTTVVSNYLSDKYVLICAFGALLNYTREVSGVVVRRKVYVVKRKL